MKKPNTVYPSSPATSASPMPTYIPDPSINPTSFDQLIQNRGIRFIHKKATICPNLRGVEENAHQPGCTFCDESGILYYDEREIWGVFTSNSLEKMFEVQGVWEMGKAVITFPAEYSNGDQADFNIYDRLVCPDFEVRMSDLIEYKPDADNKVRLKFPVASVEHMISVRNNALYTYEVDVDFTISGGKIQWIPGMEPSYNVATEIGEVISIAYVTNPVYAVDNMLHELRATQHYDPATGTKVSVRLPQQIICKRQFLFDPSNEVEQEGSQ